MYKALVGDERKRTHETKACHNKWTQEERSTKWCYEEANQRQEKDKIGLMYKLRMDMYKKGVGENGSWLWHWVYIKGTLVDNKQIISLGPHCRAWRQGDNSQMKKPIRRWITCNCNIRVEEDEIV